MSEKNKFTPFHQFGVDAPKTFPSPGASARVRKSHIPLVALSLPIAACQEAPGSTNNVPLTSGSAQKGSLEDFRVFIDDNGNGVFDPGEANTLSARDGSFTLAAGNRAIYGQSTDGTVDHASGQVLTSVFLSAPPGATVISPLTTIVHQTAHSEDAVRAALGLDVDLLHFSPFDAEHLQSVEAMRVEHASQQIMTLTRSLTGLGEGLGLESYAAFRIASQATNALIEGHIGSGGPGTVALWGEENINIIFNAFDAGLMTTGVSVDAFHTLRSELAVALDLINQRILAVGDISSAEARAVFTLPVELYHEIKAAAAALASGEAHTPLTIDGWSSVRAAVSANGYTPPTPPAPPAQPNLTISVDATGISVVSDLDAGLFFQNGTKIMDLTASTVASLTTSTALQSGTLYARTDSGGQSSASEATVAVGTGGSDTIDRSTSGAGVDFILGGAGNDYILSGSGNDHVIGGDGDDVIKGGAGEDALFGNSGNDVFEYTATADLFTSNTLVDTIEGGTGANSLRISSNTTGTSFAIFATDDWSTGISDVEKILAGPSSERIDITLGDTAFEAGIRTVDLTGDTAAGGSNLVDVSRETGALNAYTLRGSNQSVNILYGGAGADDITGGTNADIISGGASGDTMRGLGGDDVYVLDGVVTGDNIIEAANGGTDRIFVTDTADLTGLTVNGSSDFQGTVSGQGIEEIVLPVNRYVTMSGAQLSGNAITLNQAASGAPYLVVNIAGGETVDLSGLQFSKLQNAYAIDGYWTQITLKSAAGNTSETITGTAISDMFEAGGGMDTLNGGAGDDYFVVAGTAEGGEDIIDGGDGTWDTIFVTASTVFEQVDDNIRNVERIWLRSQDGSEIRLDLRGQTEDLVIIEDASTSSDEVDTIFGGEGDDYVTLYQSSASFYGATVMIRIWVEAVVST